MCFLLLRWMTYYIKIEWSFIFTQMTRRFVIFLSILLSCCLSVVSRIKACLLDISSWISLNKLKLNGNKTELLIIGSQFRPTLRFPPVALDDGSVILPSEYARNFGVTFDIILNFEHHVTDICKSCYFNILNIYRIRKFLSTEHTKILVNNAFVTSRLDKCNSLLYGLPRCLLYKITACAEMQSWLNFRWLQI